MNLFLGLFVIFLSIWKGDWRNWEKYYPSMLYIALATFVYEYISHEHFLLWELQEDSFINRTNTHFVHNLIINPLSAFVYLSNFPTEGIVRMIIYNGKWIIVFWIVECVASWMNIITYHNGWNLGWSLLFLTVMFPMVHLHHVNKRLALPLSVFFTVLLLFLFDYI
ncbi:hypothetical protein JI666_16805 [Bacillus sp. NTK071]|uniref:CBO0543 family protein n=1 Tax=Bacillus sp. NTK071 TaxID=2802175 RepID=UPI001A8D6C46|nr:CBO0543 family protein [Bacillus sp. NTK071]MBN8210416.1 hypothetical protein [Bacillus sp. NTK071]